VVRIKVQKTLYMSDEENETAEALVFSKKELARLLVELLDWTPERAKTRAEDLVEKLGHSEWFFHEDLSFYLERPIYDHYGRKLHRDVMGDQRSDVILAVERYRRATETGTSAAQIVSIRTAIEKVLGVG